VYDRLLPFVTPPAPLGEANPAAIRDSGMRLYAQPLAQMSGPLTGAPPSPYSRAAPALLVQSPPGVMADGLPPKRGTGWTIRHSLWLLPTLAFGWFTWASFGYIGVRHQRRSWLIASVLYFIVPAAGLGLAIATSVNGALGNVAVALWLLPWPVGFLHALIVNFNTRLPMLKR
jgi:hypothetical protein